MNIDKKEFPDPPKPLKPQHIAKSCGSVHFIFTGQEYWERFKIIQESSRQLIDGSDIEHISKVEFREEDLVVLEEFIREYKLMLFDINARQKEIDQFFEEHPDHPRRPDNLPF